MLFILQLCSLLALPQASVSLVGALLIKRDNTTVPLSSAIQLEASAALEVQRIASTPAIPLPTNITEYPQYEAVRQMIPGLPPKQEGITESVALPKFANATLTSLETHEVRRDSTIEARQSGLRVLVVGDSISHGQEGDWTWRYRIWQWFQQNSISVRMVGPYEGTKAPPPPTAPQPPPLYGSPADTSFSTSGGYAAGVDPSFLSNSYHFAVWGRAAAVDKDLIQGVLQQNSADLMLLMLGFNDLGWFYTDVEGTLASIQTLITNARSVNPGLKFAVANIPHRTHIGGRDDLVRNTDTYNNLLPGLLSSMSTTQSPIHVVDIASNYACADSGCPGGYDGLHPNAWGEYQIAHAFSQTLVNDFEIGSSPLVVPSQGDSSLVRDLPTPSNIRAFSSPQGVTVTWDAVYGAHSYDVDCYANGIRATFSPGNVPSNRWDSQWPLDGWEYTISVRATAGDNRKSGYTAPVTARASPRLAPPPQNIHVQPTSDGFQVSWDPPSGGDTGSIVEYNILYWDWESNHCSFLSGAAFKTSPAVIDKLIPGRNYAVWLVTWNENGQGLPAGSFSVIPGRGYPGTPSGLQVNSNDPTTVHLTWNQDNSVGGYRVWYRNVNLAGSQFSLIGNVTMMTSGCNDQYFLFPGVWNYAFAISSFNGDLESNRGLAVLAPSPASGVTLGNPGPTCAPEPSWCPGGGSVSVPPVGGSSTIIGGITTIVGGTTTVIDGSKTVIGGFTTIIGGVTTARPGISVIGGTTVTTVESGTTKTTVIGGITRTTSAGAGPTITGLPVTTNGRCTGPDCVNGVCIGLFCISLGCSGSNCFNGVCIGPDCTPAACMGPNCVGGVCKGLGCLNHGCLGPDCGDGEDGGGGGGGGGSGHCFGLHCISLGCSGPDCVGGKCIGINCSQRSCTGSDCYVGSCAGSSCTSYGGVRGGGSQAPDDGQQESCTTSSKFPTCTSKFVVVTSVFPEQSSKKTSTSTITSCYTITACTGSATTVSTTTQTATTITDECSRSNCDGTCGSQKRYEAPIGTTNDTVLKRDYPVDGSGDWSDYYKGIKEAPETLVLNNYDTTFGSNTAVIQVKWTEKRQNLLVEGLHGCMALLCASESGATVVHFWQNPTLDEWDQLYQEDVVNILNAFFGPQKFSPYQIGGYPHCWIMGATDLPMDGNDETSQATLHASDPRAMRHKDKADAIQKRILELNPDARVSQWTYARQTSRAFQGGDFGYGKAVILFDPNLKHLQPGGIELGDGTYGVQIRLQADLVDNWIGHWLELQIWRAQRSQTGSFQRPVNIAYLANRNQILDPCGSTPPFLAEESVLQGSDITDITDQHFQVTDKSGDVVFSDCAFKGEKYAPTANEADSALAGMLTCKGSPPTVEYRCYRPLLDNSATTCGTKELGSCGRLGQNCDTFYQKFATCIY